MHNDQGNLRHFSFVWGHSKSSLLDILKYRINCCQQWLPYYAIEHQKSELETFNAWLDYRDNSWRSAATHTRSNASPGSVSYHSQVFSKKKPCKRQEGTTLCHLLSICHFSLRTFHRDKKQLCRCVQICQSSISFLFKIFYYKVNRFHVFNRYSSKKITIFSPSNPSLSFLSSPTP